MKLKKEPKNGGKMTKFRGVQRVQNGHFLAKKGPKTPKKGLFLQIGLTLVSGREK